MVFVSSDEMTWPICTHLAISVLSTNYIIFKFLGNTCKYVVHIELGHINVLVPMAKYFGQSWEFMASYPLK
jgi:hypothetical protein